MTEDEAIALGDRLAAIGFRFGPGVLDMQGRTWGPDLLFRQHEHDRLDLRDPATCGVVVARLHSGLLRAFAEECVRQLEARHVPESG